MAWEAEGEPEPVWWGLRGETIGVDAEGVSDFLGAALGAGVVAGVPPVFCGRSGVEVLADNAFDAEFGGRLLLPAVVFGVLPAPETGGVGNPVFFSNLLALDAFTGV